MNRILLLAAVSTVALSGAAFAKTTPPPATCNILPNGASAGSYTVTPCMVLGGSSLISNVINKQIANFNTAYATSKKVYQVGYIDPSHSVSGLYYTSGSGSGRRGVIYNSVECLNVGASCQKSSGIVANYGGAYSVQMGASDVAFSTAELTTWGEPGFSILSSSNSTSYGYTTAGNLLQIPSMGTGVAVAFNAGTGTANNSLNLTDAELCGIFSGTITNWDSITGRPASLAGTAITVVYRSDDSGTSGLFTNHLANVCTASNSGWSTGDLANAQNRLGQTTFPNMFYSSNPSTATVPATNAADQTITWAPSSGTSGVYASIAGTLGAIGYISPDYTLAAPSSDSTSKSLTVAKINGITLTATTINISLNTTTNKTAPDGNATAAPSWSTPTSANATHQAAFVPVLPSPNTTTGYPIVGFTTFAFPQCYADAKMAATVTTFINDDYAKETTEQTNNLFVPLASIKKVAPVVAAIKASILSNTSGFNLNINNSSVCTGIGR